MRRPSLDKIPTAPELPVGYVLREYQSDDLAPLATLLDLAFDDMNWTPETVLERLIDAPDVKKTYIIAGEGKLVATASARILPEEFPGSGYLHWVAVHPEHRGKQLGAIISIAVLKKFVALGCKDAVLETQDSRLPAIKIYKKLGFEEVHIHPSHKLRWAMVAELLASANL
jgi:mycothiol synthase